MRTSLTLTALALALTSLLRAAPGNLDASFTPPLNPAAGLLGMAVQPDGKVIVTGGWTSLGAGGHRFIARLTAATGSVDETFVTTVADGPVRAVRIQPDGKMLIVGGFTMVNSTARSRIARLNADGTLDSSFASTTITGGYEVNCVAVQTDGKVLIGGNFTTVNGTSRPNLARLNTDGTLDTGFDASCNGPVVTMTIKSDGRILVGGSFYQIGGGALFARYGLALLESSGSLNTSTMPLIGDVRCVALQPDGKILVGGQFDQLGGTYYYSMVRVKTDGTFDTSFVPNFGVQPSSAPAVVESIALQADGKILVGGEFVTTGGVTRNRVSRINADGSLDTSFDPNADNTVKSVAIQPDGKMLVGGSFAQVGSVSRGALARYENSLPSETLSVTGGTRIEWLRGGSAPEAVQVVFEQSTDGGTTWTTLGYGTRISGGWELTGLSLQTPYKLRASALTNSGLWGASGGVAQTVEDFPYQAPVIALENSSGTPLTSGGTAVNLGNVVSGTSGSAVPFTIRNTGSGQLRRLQFSVTGAHAADFVITPPASAEIAPGGSAVFNVVFSPAAKLTRNATVTIASSDPATPLFTLDLTGAGIASPNADLSNITLPGPMSLSPAFATGTTSYTATAIFTQSTLILTPAAVNPASTIRVNGTVVNSGSPSQSIDLTTGANTINIEVTAEDGANTKTYVLNITRATAPAPGELDPLFVSYLSGEASALAVQGDGRIVVAGSFNEVAAPSNSPGSIARSGAARMNPNGSFDNFGPLFPGSQGHGVCLLDNGQILVSGLITTGTPMPASYGIVLVDGVTGNKLPGFAPVVDGPVLRMLELSSSKILIVGGFNNVSNVPRNRVAVLNTTGTLDSTFNPNVNGNVRSAALQSDGKIIIGGAFTQIGSTARTNVARLNTNGTVDTSFTAFSEAGTEVYCVLVQPDGKILVGGTHSTGDGLYRLNSDGTLDSSFDSTAAVGGRLVTSVELQEDGKVIAVGYGSGTYTAIERHNTNGSRDTTFNATVAGGASVVRAALIDDQGKIVVAGGFTSVNGVNRVNVARIDTGAAQTLNVVSSTSVEWSRTSLPPAQSTSFDFSTDGGQSWTPFDNTGTKVGSVWQGTGTTPLPITGCLVRGRAVISDGLHGDQSFIVNYSPPVPDIAIEQPPSTDRTSGDTIDFGTLGLNVTADLTFIVRNQGGLPLTGVDVTITGPNAAMFKVTDDPNPTTQPLESTGFVIQAKITSTGPKSAVLHVASNDPDEDPFDINLTATGAAANLPVVATTAATNVAFVDVNGTDVVQATLNGTVDANGVTRNVYFDYGLTTTYGSTVSASPATVNDANAVPVSLLLSGLLPHKTYNYRVRAESPLGDATGANKTFTTPNHTPVTQADSAVVLPQASVTIDVLDNDSDKDGDTLTITAKSAVTPSTAGTVAISNGQLVFTANTAFGTAPNTSATFTYTVSDSFAGGTATGTVTVTPGTCQIDPLTTSVPSAGVTYDVDIFASGAPWSITEPTALAWASVTPVKGIGDATVQVTLLPNTSVNQRTGTIKMGGVVHTITQAGVQAPVVGTPVLTNTTIVGPFATVVGERNVSITIPCTNFPVTFTVASGTLPPGMTLNGATGVISGIPTKGGAYNFSIKATNARNSSTTGVISVTVDTLLTTVVGLYHGYVSPSASAKTVIEPHLGGRLEVTTLPTGGFTGLVYEGFTKRSFSGTLEATPATRGTPVLKALLTGTAYSLNLTLDAATNTLSGSMSDGTNTTMVEGWRNAWSTIAPVNKADSFAGLNNFFMENLDTVNGPQGFSYASFNVNPANGGLTITGKMADETKTTATSMTTTFISQQGKILFYLPLYGGRGACSGVITVNPGVSGDNQTKGTLTWIKPAPLGTSSDTVYRTGFGPLTIDVEGNYYTPPGKGQRVLGAPAVVAPANNATVAFADGGLAPDFAQALRLTNPSATGQTNTATFPLLSSGNNPNNVSMPVVAPLTGLFSGKFVLPVTPARTAPYYGLIIRNVTAVSDITRGYGFFLLPSAPGTGETVSTSPKLSGNLLLTAP